MTTALITLVAETCCRGDCGLTFGLERNHRDRLIETHQDFYCPNGHSQHYTAKTEAEKLKDELAREKHRHEQAQASSRQAWELVGKKNEELGHKRRQLAAAKAVRTKMLKRAEAGVCLKCHRTFPALADHMAQKHGAAHGKRGPRNA